jgi:hypothetical protein
MTSEMRVMLYAQVTEIQGAYTVLKFMQVPVSLSPRLTKV